MSKKSMWVRLPEGSQVTMSRAEYEKTQRMGPLSKLGVGALLVGVLWLMGHSGDNPSTTPDHRPTPHATATVEVRGNE